jgi:hypothetical protein
MRIGILTQPLHNNYGGLLQCYALQTVLKRMGHEPWVIQRIFWKEISWLNGVKNIVKSILGKSDCFLSKRGSMSNRVGKLIKESSKFVNLRTWIRICYSQ